MFLTGLVGRRAHTGGPQANQPNAAASRSE
jgi:hypothetical protein